MDVMARISYLPVSERTVSIGPNGRRSATPHHTRLIQRPADGGLGTPRELGQLTQ